MADYTDDLLVISIETLDDEDYDGNPVQTKTVAVTINGEHVPMNYACDSSKLDADIQTDVKADLTDRGYVWSL